MSIEKLLHRYAGPANGDDIDEVDDQGTYGLLRSARDRAFMVELRKTDGRVLALPYPTIERIFYSPDEGIRILAGGREIRITGLHLNNDQEPRVGLFGALCRHRATWIRESSRAALLNPDKPHVMVESLTW